MTAPNNGFLKVAIEDEGTERRVISLSGWTRSGGMTTET